MEFQEVVRKRRMVRQFDPERPVPRETLERIVGNGRRGPSAGFSQGMAFLVLDTPETTAMFWEATNQPGQQEGTGSDTMRSAPAVIVPLAHKQAYLDRYAEPDKGFPPNYEARWRIPHWYVDTAFATMLMLLTVVDEELGAIFFSIRDPHPLRDAFGVPDVYDPIGAIALGYRMPDVLSPSLNRGRKPVEEIVHWGRW